MRLTLAPAPALALAQALTALLAQAADDKRVDEKVASLAALWRRFAEANAPNLQLKVAGAPVEPLQAPPNPNPNPNPNPDPNPNPNQVRAPPNCGAARRRRGRSNRLLR